MEQDREQFAKDVRQANLIAKIKDGERAFDKILREMRPMIAKEARRFKIPGLTAKEVLQEAIFCFRFKACRHYSADDGFRFGSFATLCVRRHLATTLKTAVKKAGPKINQ